MKESLIEKYLPADYSDRFTRRIKTGKKIEPGDLLTGMFGMTPGWVNVLMKIRNMIVKPFGIKSGNLGTEFSKTVNEQNDDEVVIGMDDKHLEFHVSVGVFAVEKNEQEITVTTVVKYHNTLGRLYFFMVFPFHKIIVPVMTDRVIAKIIIKK
ncbi:MAG: DUF2867 domain-containing protein [Barnesiella sp.]